MPHSFSVLNFATCDAKRLASAPNHGYQTFTWTPRNASFSTFKLLTAGTGVFEPDALPVAFGPGVRVLEAEGAEGVHAENRNSVEKRAMQALRKMGISRLPWGWE